MELGNREYLDPHKPLLDEVADWLFRRDRASLEHILVVVPTAQSGRNLRLALARRAGVHGLLPPQVVLPMQLVKPAMETPREATKAELSACFLKFLKTPGVAPGPSSETRYPHLFRTDSIADTRAQLSLFDQLSDVWRILAGGGLIMADVLAREAARSVLEKAAGDEVARWRELEALEAAFFKFLHAHGVSHPSENVRLAQEHPQPLDAEIEEVVLPALADPIRVLGDVLSAQRPELKITTLVHEGDEPANFDTRDIVLCSDTADLARRVVADFPSASSEAALPSLAILENEAFPDVSSAFLNAGYTIHNPERHPLAISSLGRLVCNLAELYAAGPLPWKPFITALRSDDVIKALTATLPVARAEILTGADFVQNRFLPQFVPADCVFPAIGVSSRDQAGHDAFTSASVAFSGWLTAAREGRALTAFLRRMLQTIFSHRTLTLGAGEEEFRAAAACAWEALDSLESETIVQLELEDAAYGAIVRRALDAANYSLEPDSPEAIKTEGWLELAWSEAAQFTLVGFHEGAVPDSLVGHPFVPDSLRHALGLVTNADRLARDTRLFRELVCSHAPHAVRAYVAKTNNAGDICRPSRLLYLCPERKFPSRMAALFGDCVGEPALFPRTVADRWRLRLPDAVPLPRRDAQTPTGRLSASAIDQYVRCPFTYLLKFALGMEPVEEKTELGYDDFGSLVHRVLEAYAREQISQGEAQLAEAGAIRATLARLVREACRAYGERPSVNVALQLEALAGRLDLFADIQAQWAGEGWRIVEHPEYRFLVQPFRAEGDDTWIKGSIDRIDYHPEFGYRLIDYKSWDRKSDAAKHVARGGTAQGAFAAQQHFPLLDDGRRLMTVQLPLYAQCLAASDAKFRHRIADLCYLVLGEDAENVCVFGSAFPQGRFEAQARNRIRLVDTMPLAMETAQTAIRHIRDNLFWPPGPGEEWKYDIKNLLVATPEKDMGAELAESPAWLKGQLAKLEACS